MIGQWLKTGLIVVLDVLIMINSPDLDYGTQKVGFQNNKKMQTLCYRFWTLVTPSLCFDLKVSSMADTFLPFFS